MCIHQSIANQQVFLKCQSSALEPVSELGPIENKLLNGKKTSILGAIPATHFTTVSILPFKCQILQLIKSATYIFPDAKVDYKCGALITWDTLLEHSTILFSDNDTVIYQVGVTDDLFELDVLDSDWLKDIDDKTVITAQV